MSEPDPTMGSMWQELIGVSPDVLIAKANQRASDLDLTPSPNDHRNVINMLRHEYTCYDGHVRNSRTDRLYEEMLDAIARDFPWLADQCAADKATHFDRMPPWAQARRLNHLDSQDRQRAARQAIKGMAVGDRVMVTWRGPREAVITELRRTRIKAEFTLPDGTVEWVDRRADEVTPIGHQADA
jgi:hypothetical protein